MIEQIKIRAENNASGEIHASRHSRNYPSLILLPSDTGVHKNPYRACCLLYIFFSSRDNHRHQNVLQQLLEDCYNLHLLPYP